MKMTIKEAEEKFIQEAVDIILGIAKEKVNQSEVDKLLEKVYHQVFCGMLITYNTQSDGAIKQMFKNLYPIMPSLIKSVKSTYNFKCDEDIDVCEFIFGEYEKSIRSKKK